MKGHYENEVSCTDFHQREGYTGIYEWVMVERDECQVWVLHQGAKMNQVNEFAGAKKRKEKPIEMLLG